MAALNINGVTSTSYDSINLFRGSVPKETILNDFLPSGFHCGSFPEVFGKSYPQLFKERITLSSG